MAADDNVDYTTFFLPALNVLFQCLSSTSSSMYAAKAILQLCVHGQKILVAPSLANGVRETAGGVGCNQLVDALISVTVEKIADDSLAAPPEDPLSGAGGGGSAAAAAHPMLTVIEAVVRTIVALPDNTPCGSPDETGAPHSGLSAPRDLRGTQLRPSHAAHALRRPAHSLLRCRG